MFGAMKRAQCILPFSPDWIICRSGIRIAGLLVFLLTLPMTSTSQPIQFATSPQKGTFTWDHMEWTLDELTRQGEFSAARRMIDNWTNHSEEEETILSSDQLRVLKMQSEWMRRVAKDYGLNRRDLLSQLQRRMEGATERELNGWIEEGRFDQRIIDGELKFIRPSISNLYFRYPELNARRVPKPNPKGYQEKLLRDARQVQALAASEKSFQVAPVDYEILMQLTVQANVTDPGEIIRAWAPIPRGLPSQSDFEWVETRPAYQSVESPDSLIRSVYFELPAIQNHPTIFELRYKYTARASWFPVLKTDEASNWKWKSGMSSAPQKWSSSELAPYLEEARHVEFSDGMRRQVNKIVGELDTPALKAKAIYDWIRNNIQYSYAREYSTIKNISGYCLEKGYGDCGQEALLMITMLRMEGIPARWQSGWYIFPGYETIHDWIEIYLEPFGWVPCDPYMGIYATQYGTHLTAEEQEELAGFYFGGLDPYRMAANSDHCQKLEPAKLDWRSDDVDFQRGEIESGGKNIYFDQYDYGYSIRILKSELKP